MQKDVKSKFESEAEMPQRGFLGEIWEMLKHNKKYYLIPLVAILLIFGAIIILGGTAAAPFIYTLF